MLQKQAKISRKNFPTLYSMRKIVGDFFVIYYKKADITQVSVVIPKKTISSSVVRHFVKRRFYALCGQIQLPVGIYVIFPSKKSEHEKFDILKESFIKNIKTLS